jgi:hypothetical protein
MSFRWFPITLGFSPPSGVKWSSYFVQLTEIICTFQSISIGIWDWLRAVIAFACDKIPIYFIEDLFFQP